MSCGDDLFEAFVLTVLIGVLVAMVFAAAPADAQLAPTFQGAQVRAGDDITLTRMCAGEGGLRQVHSVPACAMMVGVIARRAALQGMSMGAMAWAYSKALNSTPAARMYIHSLGDVRRPRGFRGSWRGANDAFGRMLAVVRSMLAGDVPDPCPIANHYGGVAIDGAAAEARGWIRVCPEVTVQGGYVTATHLALMLQGRR